MDSRQILTEGPTPTSLVNLNTWTAEQIRLAGAWARHEVQSRKDPLCAAYDWVPGWTGTLQPETILDLVNEYYNR